MGSLVADFKYRDVYYLWQDKEKSASLRSQFNSYHDMNTRYYDHMSERESLMNARPVKEVWAVFPRKAAGSGDEGLQPPLRVPLAGKRYHKRTGRAVGRVYKDAEELKRAETFFQTGILVLRFTNKEVFTNLSGVCEYIDYVVKQRLKELRSSQSQELYL